MFSKQKLAIVSLCLALPFSLLSFTKLVQSWNNPHGESYDKEVPLNLKPATETPSPIATRSPEFSLADFKLQFIERNDNFFIFCDSDPYFDREYAKQLRDEADKLDLTETGKYFYFCISKAVATSLTLSLGKKPPLERATQYLNDSSLKFPDKDREKLKQLIKKI